MVTLIPKVKVVTSHLISCVFVFTLQQVVLEMCRSDDSCSRQTIEPHLKRIDTYIMEQDEEVGIFFSVKVLYT